MRENTTNYHTENIKSYKEQIDLLQSEIYFLREQLKEKNNIIKLLATSKQQEKLHSKEQESTINTISNSKNKCISVELDKNHEIKITTKIEHRENSTPILTSEVKPLIKEIAGKTPSKEVPSRIPPTLTPLIIELPDKTPIKDSTLNTTITEELPSKSEISEELSIQESTDEENIHSDALEENHQSINQEEDNQNIRKETNKENNLSRSSMEQNKLAFILGDSMVKDVDGYLLTGSINRKFIVKVRPFSSAKTVDMEDYIKPTKRDFTPKLCVLHVGTNDLPLDDSPNEIAERILNTAESLKSENTELIISNVVPRGDKYKDKGESLSEVLKKVCDSKNIPIINHDNINPKRHPNRSKLHFNGSGKSFFVRNIRNVLNNYI